MSIAHDEFADKQTYAVQAVLGSVALNAIEDGVQDEFEARLAAWAENGVISGGGCSINGTAVDVAAIVAYTAGKRFSGSGSVDFDGQESGTFYVYLNPADEGAPLTISDEEPTGDELILCVVDWNGTDTLSNLVDLRAWGIVPEQFTFQVVGAVSADVIGIAIMGRGFWIETVQASLEDCGSGDGPTLIDVHAGDGGSETTIWTTQGNRVSIAHDATDGAVATGGVPEANRLLTAGQKLLVEVDQAATGAADLCVIVTGRYV